MLEKNSKSGRLRQTIQCPNCLQAAILEGNEITCEACDNVFTITKTGAARVKTMGKLADHEERLKKLEALLPGQEPSKAPGQADVSEGEQEEEDEESILPE